MRRGLIGAATSAALYIEGRASVVCRYRASDQLVGIGTDLEVRLAGAR